MNKTKPLCPDRIWSLISETKTTTIKKSKSYKALCTVHYKFRFGRCFSSLSRKSFCQETNSWGENSERLHSHVWIVMVGNAAFVPPWVLIWIHNPNPAKTARSGPPDLATQTHKALSVEKIVSILEVEHWDRSCNNLWQS